MNVRFTLIAALVLCSGGFITARVAQRSDQVKDFGNKAVKFVDNRGLYKKERELARAQAAQKADGKQLPAGAYLIDSIEAVIFCPDQADIITYSDTRRLGLDGSARSLPNMVQERLLFADAKKMKMEPTKESIEKHMQMVQRENKLSLDQIKQIFKQAGYSYEEGLEQMGVQQAVSQIMSFRVHSRLVVPEKEIRKYYNEHPETVEEAYQLERAVVSPDVFATEAELQAALKKYAKTGAGLEGITWSAPFWIEKSELAEEKHFIAQLTPGQIGKPQALAQGFELFRLTKKRPERFRTYEERMREISEILRRPHGEKLFNEYIKSLQQEMAVLYLTQTPYAPAA